MDFRIAQALLVTSLSLILLATGCGQDNSTSARVKQLDPATLLLSPSDLPRVDSLGSAPTEVCGPIPVFEEEGGEVAVSKRLISSDESIIEAIGVFESPRQASSAYDQLNDEERLECVGAAIRTFTKTEVEIFEGPRLVSGDESLLIRYRAHNGPEVKGYSDVVSLRVGRCIASLLIGAESPVPPKISGSASAIAADLLAPACQSK